MVTLDRDTHAHIHIPAPYTLTMWILKRPCPALTHAHVCAHSTRHVLHDTFQTEHSKTFWLQGPNMIVLGILKAW